MVREDLTRKITEDLANVSAQSAAARGREMSRPLGHRRHRLGAAAAPGHQCRAGRAGRHHPRMDRRAHRHRGAPHRRRRRDHGDAGDRGGAQGARGGRASTPSEIGLIVLATATPDQTFPASATRVQTALGIDDCIAFDVAGGLHRLPLRALGRRQYDEGRHGRSRAGDRLGDVQPHPRLGGPGDLRPVRRRRRRGRAQGRGQPRTTGILATRLHADGRHNDLLYVDGGVSTTGTVGKLRMKGKEVFRHAVVNLADVLGEVLDGGRPRAPTRSTGWCRTRPTSASSTPPRRKLGLDPAKVIVTVDQHANTSAASVPLALDAAVRDGRIKHGRPARARGDGRRLHLGRRGRPLLSAAALDSP